MTHSLGQGSYLDHGKYRVERVLGQGGFGITYLVLDIGLDKWRAIKEFFPKDFCERDETTSHIYLGTTNTEAFVERLKAKFIKEARNIANLDQHQSIVKIHSVFEENNTAYYVMDYIEGESLAKLVDSYGPLSVIKALEYITQIGEALEYVHGYRINHLDVKPANIMIRSKDDKPILIDFGLAKQYDSDGNETSTTVTGVSHGFAPFEQYKEGGVNEFSPQTDIYSLAATLYYMICGEVPPHATDLIEEELYFPQGFPLYLKEPIKRAMSLRRQNRPKSISEFLDSIRPNTTDGSNGIYSEYTQQPPSAPAVNSQQFVPENSVPPIPSAVLPPNPQFTSNPEISYISTPPGNTKRSLYVFLCVALVVVVVTTLILVPFGNKEENEYAEDLSEEQVDDSDNIMTVSKLAYETPLGICLYAGPIDSDGNPNGHGVAKWDRGEAREYDGEWVHGKMEGPAKYTHSSGDTFEGTFKDNQYEEGRYTIKDDGSYFEGTFKDGQPLKGQWYDKHGNKL